MKASWELGLRPIGRSTLELKEEWLFESSTMGSVSPTSRKALIREPDRAVQSAWPYPGVMPLSGHEGLVPQGRTDSIINDRWSKGNSSIGLILFDFGYWACQILFVHPEKL